MYFKADYDKLSDISRASLNKCNELVDLYSDILKILTDIEKNWVSNDDSYIYLCKMQDFMKARIDEVEALYSGSFTLNNVSMLYGDQDDKWAREVENSKFVRNTLTTKEVNNAKNFFSS